MRGDLSGICAFPHGAIVGEVWLVAIFGEMGGGVRKWMLLNKIRLHRMDGPWG